MDPALEKAKEKALAQELAMELQLPLESGSAQASLSEWESALDSGKASPSAQGSE